MELKIITNQREFLFNTDSIKLTGRGAKGTSLLNMVKVKLKKGESLLRLEEM